MPLSNHVAIYGGSYDPFHFGHLQSILWLLETLNAEKVLIAPTFKHAFGKNLTQFQHRINMCERSIGLFDDDSVRVMKDECHLPHPNTTLNLLRYAKLHYPDNPMSVVIGSDLLSGLDKWKDWDKVVKEAKVVVIGRAGTEKADTNLNVYQYPIEITTISSSDIRRRVVNGESITGLVSKSVDLYIREHNLYK